MNPEIRNFIEAVKGVELAKRQLHIEEGELKLVREALTKAFFGPDGKADGDIPESFAVMYEGIPYLIQIDTEGDHGHTIKRIGAIMTQDIPY